MEEQKEKDVTAITANANTDSATKDTIAEENIIRGNRIVIWKIQMCYRCRRKFQSEKHCRDKRLLISGIQLIHIISVHIQKQSNRNQHNSNYK